MSGLPPTGHHNKVSVRSKTASFKRPISCDVSEHKKENRGIFNKLKKGSSNSRLDEESQYGDNIYKTNNNNTFSNDQDMSSMPPRMAGRNFDSDDDFELDSGETVVTKMEKLFVNDLKVIKNPALVGSVLKYLIMHNLDYYSLMFYLIAQYYKIVIQSKDYQKEALRLINEIYTTFLHEKSVLRVQCPDLKPINFDDLKMMKDYSTVFDDHCNIIFNQVFKKQVEKVKKSILHGLFNVEMHIEGMNFDEKLSNFTTVIKWILKNLEEKVPQTHNATKETKENEQFFIDLISAVKSSLATIYCYFCKKEKDENSDTSSIMSSKINSFLGKSSENLTMLTNCTLDKQPMFCSKVHKRSGSHSFFKKGKVIKGHNFMEKVFEYPAECLQCKKLLWGIAPQGVMCTVCQGGAHRNCREFVRVTCEKDSKKYQRNSSMLSAHHVDDETHKNSIVEEAHIEDNSNKTIINVNNNVTRDTHDKQDTIEVEKPNQSADIEPTPEEAMQLSTSSISSNVSHIVKPNYIVSTATIVVTNNDEKPMENFDTESLDSVLDSIDKLPIDFIKSENDRNEFRSDEKSHVKTMANKYDQKSIPRSQSENSMDSSTLPRTSKRTSESVHVQDLVQDENMWLHDPDMDVGETFEADKELEAFPDHLSKDQDKAEYTRLLVLMEFHHKIKFTVMNLKRFDYLLIKAWPQDDNFLFGTLRLNCIIPLYSLTKNLADTIESCREKSTFNSNTAKKVHEWLVNNEEANLQEWLKYSIDLCCTNSLVVVKNTLKEYRKSEPRFHNVLNKRFNRKVMVEELWNMRPLLFNLPLILNKLVRDLSKFSKYKEEGKIWKEILEIFKRLPTYIDERCMPLVQLINNGTIINSVDRTGWQGKIATSDPCYDYIIDFPKTAFHYKIFDFQEIKISNFRESGNKIKTPAVFVKETCDAYAICYETMLVLLQKENDKYLLKQFKASDATKSNPILTVDNVHASKGEGKGIYELTLVFINVAVLTQVLFQKKDIMERWHDFIYKSKNRNLKKNDSNGHDSKDDSFSNEPLPKENSIINNNEFYSKSEDEGENCNDKSLHSLGDDHWIKFETLKESTHDYLSSLNVLKYDENNENILFINPNDSNELLIGTAHNISNLLKLCNDNIRLETLNKSSPANYINDDLLDQMLSQLSVMKNRVMSYKNSRDKDALSINDVDCAISDNIEPCFQSIQNTYDRDSSIPNESEEIDKDSLQIMDNSVLESVDRDVQETDLLLGVVDGLIVDEIPLAEQSDIVDPCDDLASFVDSYVNKIIADAQREIYQSSDSDSSSINHFNSQQDSLYSDQISEPSA